MSCLFRTITSAQNKLLFSRSLQKVFNFNSNITSIRPFVLSTISLTRIYHDNENTFAHSILVENDLYKKTMFKKDYVQISKSSIEQDNFTDFVKQQWEMKANEDIVIAFKELARHANHEKIAVSCSDYNDITKAIVNKINEFSDDQIWDLLLYLSLFSESEGINANNFVDLWNALDKTCKSRATYWDTEKRLFYCDLWYNIKLLRYSKFADKVLTQFSRRLKTLTPQQVIQTMFYINVSRRPPCTMYDFELCLQNYLDVLNIHEISIMAMGFFKTKSPIRNPYLLEHIIYRTIESADTIHEIALCALAKIIKYSLTITNIRPVSLLMQNLIKQIPRLSVPCCIHIALLGTKFQMFNLNLIKEIVNKLNANIEAFRIKDLERLSFVLAICDYEDNDVFHKIIKELKNPNRSDELTRHPRSYACCVHFLSLKSAYDMDILNELLSTSFINKAYGESYFNVGREIFHLDNSAFIELPSYTGNTLSQAVKLKLANKWTRDINEEDKPYKSDMFLLDVLKYVRKLYKNEKSACSKHILPHFSMPDVVICLNNDGEPQSVVWESFLENGEVEAIDKSSECKWLAFVVVSKNNTLFGNNKYTGMVVAKLRQLQTLGYLPITVPWFEWFDLKDAAKETYLKNLIDSILNDSLKTKSYQDVSAVVKQI